MNNGSNDLLNFKPRELTPKNPVKNFSWPRLAIQLSKERFFRLKQQRLIYRLLKPVNKKNAPTNLSRRKFIFTHPYCRCKLTVKNCQLRFNYFHNNLTLLKGKMYFNTKRFFVKNFLYLFWLFF